MKPLFFILVTTALLTGCAKSPNTSADNTTDAATTPADKPATSPLPTHLVAIETHEETAPKTQVCVYSDESKIPTLIGGVCAFKPEDTKAYKPS